MANILALSSRLSALCLRNALPNVERLLAPISSSHQLISTVHSERLKNVPKRPVNAFVAWLQDNRPSIQRQQPGISTVEVMRVAGRKWRDMTDSEKQEYKENAENDMKVYKEEMKAVRQSLSAEEKEELLDLARTKKKKRAKMRKNKLLHQLGKPKRSLSAFAFYVQHEMSTRPYGEGVVDYMRELGTHWRGMSEGEKEPFVQKSLKDRERYDDELKVWEMQMIQDGYANLVRSPPKKK